MTSANVTNQTKQTTVFLLNNKPTAPVNTKQPSTEKRIADPSSVTPKGRCYPIPAFFEYRAKPKEYDLL